MKKMKRSINIGKILEFNIQYLFKILIYCLEGKIPYNNTDDGMKIDDGPNKDVNYKCAG